MLFPNKTKVTLVGIGVPHLSH